MINRKKILAKTKAILIDEEVQQNSDMHIDQDFPGFPHLPSDRKNISGQKNVVKKSSAIINVGTTKNMKNIIIID